MRELFDGRREQNEMLNNFSTDAYNYLKTRGWGKFLIALVLLAIVLFSFWISLTSNQKDSLLPALRSTSPQQSGQQGANDIGMRFTDEEMSYRNLVLNTCRATSNPRGDYELASALETVSARDQEYGKIAVDAVCAGDEPFAFELLAKLNSPQVKDAAARQAITFYLNKKRFTDAQQWVAFLSNVQDREWWMRRILGESRNSASRGNGPVVPTQNSGIYTSSPTYNTGTTIYNDGSVGSRKFEVAPKASIHSGGTTYPENWDVTSGGNKGEVTSKDSDKK